ncbi:MAG: ThuA domain-containing protein, partial [Betaproteobacteria bacterium]
MTRALVLSGGVTHDFPALATELTALLAENGVTADVREDAEEALRHAAEYDLLVVNMLRWRMESGPYAAQRERWGLSLSAASRSAFTEFVHGGKGMLALHAATICFDDWPEW